MTKHIVKKYVVISTKRSGTNLFFDLLIKNKLAKSDYVSKRDFEIFHPYLIQKINLKRVSLKDIITKQINKTSYINNELKIQCFKLFPAHITYLLNKYNNENNTRKNLNDFFDCLNSNTLYIRIERKDKIRQAVSSYKAEKTGIWISNKNYKMSIGHLLRRMKNVFFENPLSLNYDNINYILDDLKSQEEAISNIIDKRSLPHLNLEYEAFSKNLHKTIKGVSRFLDIKTPKINTSTDLEIQRNSNSEKLYKKYVRKKLNHLDYRAH